jgi:hypothetical protein
VDHLLEATITAYLGVPEVASSHLKGVSVIVFPFFRTWWMWPHAGSRIPAPKGDKCP